MDENDTGEAAERKHAVSAMGAFFDSAYVMFNVRDMFVGRGGVQCRVPGAKDFEFVVGENCVNGQAARQVEGQNLLVHYATSRCL